MIDDGPVATYVCGRMRQAKATSGAPVAQQIAHRFPNRTSEYSQSLKYPLKNAGFQALSRFRPSERKPLKTIENHDCRV